MNRLKILLAFLAAAIPQVLPAQVTETYTFTTNRLLPDGNPAGLTDVRTLNSAITSISSVTMQLNTTGQFNGDLYGYIVHSNGFTVLLNRPGKTASNPAGYADSGFNVTFQDGAANGDIHLYQNVTTPAAGAPLTGTWQPDGRNVDPATVTDTSPRTTGLTNLNGLNASGQWTLFMADMQSGGTNELTEWTLTIVGKAAPTLTWANPSDIVYGTALGASQLNAAATFNSTNVPGTFVYTPAAGTVLSAGSGQTLSVTFTPADPNTFLPVSATVTINVDKATPVITWANPSGIVYGTALSGTQLNATANVPGTFVYSPALGTVPGAGNGQTLSTTFTPTDTTDYNTANASVTINVSKATPVITWANPSGIVYGTALSGTQLNATANVSGTFVYSPALGTVPGAGIGQTLSTTFTPADTTDYNTANASVTINVSKATPIITWANPSGIVYGTALSGTQLDATANVSGTFVYSPASGTVLGAGNGQTLTTTFTPTDAADYNTANSSVTINVAKATPVITWANPSGIVYGTALSGTQLNATANVPGTFVYSPALGTVPGAGNGQTLTTTFTPTDTTDYNTANASVTINVSKATPIITWANPSGIVYGTALSGTQLNATANVPGTFVYSPASGTVLGAGNGQTLSTTFTPTDAADYNTANSSVTINVAKATPVITWGNPSGIVYGTALSNTQLNATANVPGTFVYSPALGTVLGAGSGQTLSTTFTPTDTTDYNTANASVTMNIAKATTTGGVVASANPALPGTSVTFTATISPVAPATSSPTGTVNYRINGAVGGSDGLSGGVAAFATNGLPHATNTVVAEYAGDQNFIGTTNTLTPAEVINTPPVAGNITIERYTNETAKVSVATVLAACSDADGDPLSITVSSTSANGGTVAVSGGWIYYTPPAGFTSGDSFTYTVSDGFGGSAVGTITVAILVDNSVGQNLVITSLGNGSYLINGQGIPGYTYTLQHATTLNPADWENVTGGSLTAGTTGAFQFTDTPSGGMGFYRTVYP